jgi:hypothetical protein
MRMPASKAPVAATDVRTRKKRIVVTTARPREDIVRDICERVAIGGSVAGVCRGNPEFPVADVFWRWIAGDPDLLTMYEAALVMRAHTFAEELIAIADDASGDWI